MILCPLYPLGLTQNVFRPEKDHAKQIYALEKLFEMHPEHKSQGVRLVLLGSSRNVADAERIEVLRRLVVELKLEVRGSLFHSDQSA